MNKMDSTHADGKLGDNIKLEDEFDDCQDDKVFVNETVLSGAYIKQEPCDMKDEQGSFYNFVDIKEENINDPTVIVQETGLTTNIKGNCSISCEECNGEYDLYCLKCPMLIRIFNSNKLKKTDNSVRQTLPKNFIDICETPSGVGIVALRVIPKGVVFGPFEGLDSTKDGTVSKWKLKDKELTYVKDPKRLNWMQYIKMADLSSHRNLTSFQYEDRLYYRSDCHISTGDELLVYWDSDNEESGILYMEDGYWTPQICEKMDDTYACTLCCVGYKSICHLTAHNSRCPEKGNLNNFCKEIIQCALCKIYLDEKEYSDYHIERCCIGNTKKYVAATGSPKNTDKPELTDKYKCSMCEYSTSQKHKIRKHQLTHTDFGMYRCPQCPYRARREYFLQKHMRTHANYSRSRSRYKCEHCGEQFARSDVFATHQKRVHSILAYKCDKCVFEAKNARELVRHLTTHEDAKPYSCDTCNKQFKLEKTLLVHARICHNGEKKQYKCPKCNYETMYPRGIKIHLLNMHSGVKRFKCSRCAFKTCYKSTLDRHLRYHEHQKSIKCESCDIKFLHTKLLSRHMKEVHAIFDKTYGYGDQKSFTCTLCPHKTTTNSAMKIHMTVHTTDRPFKCNMCAQMFKLKGTLAKHVRYIHLKAEKKEYKCPQCPFETKYKVSFKQHMNAHNKNELFQCSKCDFNTHHKGTFSAHKNRHEETKKQDNKTLKDHKDSKSFACSLCPYKTAKSSNLKIHIAVHNDDKPFKCNVCAQMFKRKISLVSHARNIHSKDGKREYKCPQCPFETKYNSSFKKHVNAHNKSVLFQCLKCDFNTYHRSTFNNHRKQHEQTKKHDNKIFKGEEGSKSLDCPTCGTTFKYKRNLASHIKRRHASKIKEEKSWIESDN